MVRDGGQNCQNNTNQCPLSMSILHIASMPEVDLIFLLQIKNLIERKEVGVNEADENNVTALRN